MHPYILQAIGAERSREMRERAAAWRRVREARSASLAPPANIRRPVIARLTRNARSLPGQKPLHGPAAA